MSVDADRVGLIGLGQMGSAMAATLVRHGRSVLAWDVDAGACRAAAGNGIEIALDPADVAARVSLIVTSLPGADALRDALLGERGLVAAERAGLLVIDTSTMSPHEAQALEAQAAEHGIDLIDAPVTGGPGGAADGRLGIMVGGDGPRLERARPVLEILGSTIVHCGPVGSGQVVKACNQLIVVATLGAVAEALTTAAAAGVDPAKAREALLAGYAASPILENQGARMLQRDFEPGGKARFNLKDVAALAELSATTGIALPVFDAAAGYIRTLVDAGGGDLDHSAIVTVVERAAGGEHPSGPRATEGAP